MPEPYAPSRCVLEDVPRVGFYDGTRCPEDVPFPSCLRACLEYAGETYGCKHAGSAVERLSLECTYAYLMAASGAAFRLLWNPGKWDMANTDVAVMATDWEQPFRRAFEAAGVGYEMVGKAEGRDNAALFRSRIVESIAARGVPVIAFGVVGPPECCLVTGYEDDGDALIGWSYFQAFPDSAAGVDILPSGYFRKGNWLPDTPGLFVLGERRVRPPLERILQDALAWAVEVVRTPEVYGRASGLAAYQAWAHDLLDDTAFATDCLDTLRDRYLVHFDAVGTVAEGRWYASLFLKAAAQQAPQRAEALVAAAGCYAALHDLMWKVWNAAGGNAVGEEQIRALARPEVRRMIADLLQQAHDLDKKASDQLESALG